MYEVIKNGLIIAVVNDPVWVNKADNGCLILCDEEEATGIVVDSTLYALDIEDPMEGFDIVSATRIDAGSFAVKTNQNTANLDYLAMMTGYDFPDETEQSTETEGEN